MPSFINIIVTQIHSHVKTKDDKYVPVVLEWKMPDNGETRCSLITVAIRRVFLGWPLHNGRHQLLVHDDAVLDQEALDVIHQQIDEKQDECKSTFVHMSNGQPLC